MRAFAQRRFDVSAPVAQGISTSNFIMRPGPIPGSTRVSGRVLIGSLIRWGAYIRVNMLNPYDSNFLGPPRPSPESKYINYPLAFTDLHPTMGDGPLSYMSRCHRQYRWTKLSLEYIPVGTANEGAFMFTSSTDPAMKTWAKPYRQFSPTADPTGVGGGFMIESLASSPGSVINSFRVPCTLIPAFDPGWKYTKYARTKLPEATTIDSGIPENQQEMAIAIARQGVSTSVCFYDMSAVVAANAPIGWVTLNYSIDLKDQQAPDLNGPMLPLEADVRDPHWTTTTTAPTTDAVVGSTESKSEDSEWVVARAEVSAKQTAPAGPALCGTPTPAAPCKATAQPFSRS